MLIGLLRGQDAVPRVCMPHGAESGFDPYQAYAALNDDNCIGYTHGVLLPMKEGMAQGDWVSTR